MALWEITIQQLSNRDARERWVCEIQYDRRRPPLRAQSFDEMISLIRLEHDTILAQKARKTVSPLPSQQELNEMLRGTPAWGPELPRSDAERHAETAETVLLSSADAAAAEDDTRGKFQRATFDQISQGRDLGLEIKGNWSARRAQEAIDAKLAE